jgi:PPOX class probable F420-dependent enzyme
VSTEFPPEFDDLLNAQFATLATIGKDGGPQLTEVWFLFDEGKVKISLNDSRLKTKNLRERPQCSLFILDLANPFRYLDVRGTALLEDDEDYEFAEKVGAKYGGADLKEHDGPGDRRVVVTIEPANVFAVDMNA